jgi:8-oxo-dGTP pyrophosphatase MutT (NUDIX family)
MTRGSYSTHTALLRFADCRVFSVSRTWVREPRAGGRSHPFYRIDAGEWVNVIPVTRDEEVVMVRQYRHGAREFTLEIPGGIVDPGESPVEAAARELLEETGYRAGSVQPLGALNPNPALFGNRVHTFLAEGCERVGDVVNPGLEETAVECVPRRHLDDRVRAGDIDHALVIAALHWWRLHPTGS